MDDVLVGFGVALLVVNVPTQRLEKRIKEFTAQLGFVVLAGFVSFELLFEACDQIQNFPGCGHEMTLARGREADKRGKLCRRVF